MCLTKLKKIRLHKNYGWQVLEKTDKGLLPFYMKRVYTFFTRFVPTNQWERDEFQMQVGIGPLDSPYVRTYVSGFHIFLRKKDAKEMLEKYGYPCHVIRKVYFRDMITTGYQRSNNEWPVVVAGERFVEEK